MTKIEWCTESWNPVTGCSPVGAGCLNCYAKRQALRLQRMGVPKYANGFKVTCHPDELDAKVLRKRRPQRIFVNSMSDLFHEKVLLGFVGSVLDVIWEHPQHTFIVLTKRIQRALEFPGTGSFPDNLWLGVSVSTQREADELIPILLQCPAAKHIVSYEPALEPIEWRGLLSHWVGVPHRGPVANEQVRDIDWLICGCESGPKRRPFDEDWARAARDACQELGVPFFYKQGRDEARANEDWALGRVHRAKVIHRPFLDGRRWEEYPC